MYLFIKQETLIYFYERKGFVKSPVGSHGTQCFSVDKLHVAAEFTIIRTPQPFYQSPPPAHLHPWVALRAHKSLLTLFLCSQDLCPHPHPEEGICGSGWAGGVKDQEREEDTGQPRSVHACCAERWPCVGAEGLVVKEQPTSWGPLVARQLEQVLKTLKMSVLVFRGLEEELGYGGGGCLGSPPCSLVLVLEGDSSRRGVWGSCVC